MFACVSELDAEDERHVVFKGNFSHIEDMDESFVYEGGAIGPLSSCPISLNAVFDAQNRNGSFKLAIGGQPGVSGLVTVSHAFHLVIYQIDVPVEITISADSE